MVTVLTQTRFQAVASKIARKYGVTCLWDAEQRCYWVDGDIYAKRAIEAKRAASRMRRHYSKDI